LHSGSHRDMSFMTCLLYQKAENTSNFQKLLRIFCSLVAVSNRRRTWSAAVTPCSLKCEVTMYVVPPILLSLFGGVAFTLPAMIYPPFCPKSGPVCFCTAKTAPGIPARSHTKR